MSIESVKQFLTKAKTTPDLQKRLEAIPKGGGQWTIAEVIKVAANAGFQFGAQDYEDAVNAVLAEKHAAGAIDDAELALISGGLMCTSSDGTYCLCCPNPKPRDPTTHGLTLQK